jgi:hypothetical protein
VVVGTDVAVDFVVSEELGADPVLVLDTGPRVAFEIARANGRAYRFEHRITADDFRVGVHNFTVTLADQAGHSSVVDVVLPAPFAAGLTFTDNVSSPCPVAPGNPDPCIDFDADGFFGHTEGCDRATDCNDREATVRPGAPEIPGDGFDNSCDGLDSIGDAPIDESVGVFVDPNAVVDGAGTRASPFSQLASAVAAANALGRQFIFFARGEIEGDEDSLDQSLIGGLDAETWQPTDERTTLVTFLDRLSVNASNGVFVRMHMRQGSLVSEESTTSWVDCDTDIRLFVSTQAWVVRSEGDFLVLTSELANGSRVLDSSYGDVFVDDRAADVLVDRSRIGSVHNRGGLTIANSAISSRFVRGTSARTTIFDDFNSLGVLVVHSTVESSDGDIDVNLLDVRTNLRAVNVLLVRRNAALATTVVARSNFRLELTGAVIDVPGVPTFRIENTGGLEFPEAVNECGSRCFFGSVRLEPAAILVDDPLHNLLSGAGVDRAEDIWFLPGMPSSLVRDIDEQCRYVDVPDMGPNEIP